MNSLYKGIIYKYTSPSGKVYIGQTGGYLFRYKVDSDYPAVIAINPIKAQKQIVCKYSLKGKLIREFDSITEAAKDCGMNRSWFKKYLDGKNNHIHGKFIWRRKYE